MINTFVNLS